ncbi:hypothetical protein FA95DRAFT_1605874 [Auriscalpium vulgare]|uniref:Uncharacterized protein n=1 Tax=Auriscalpium vulgare TaxID=40419 RepID=A0ACB8RUC4_9AGAM|nr:hypothetical protein FA95DRAFT_1605874 [Auriscalpium vulgare]
MQLSAALITLALAVASASARPSRGFERRAAFTLQNGKDAIALNAKFSKLTASSSCTAGEDACVGDKFAQCVGSKFVTSACSAGTVCAALPLVNSAGTSVTCTTAADRDARIAATGASGAGSNNAAQGGAAGNNKGAAAAKSGKGKGKGAAKSTSAASTAAAAAATGKGKGKGADNAGKGTAAVAAQGGDAQKSLTLDPKVIATGFADDGQDVPTAGQVASLTSKNNFINFCLTVNKPITNGQQVKTGSCNPAPMGVIAATTNMPSGKFTNPKNLDTIKANTNLTISLALKHLDAGHFTNAQETYYAAPQQVNAQGDIIGHTHVVVEKIDSLTTTKVTDPNVFQFFKGVNGAAVNGVVSADVPGGLPVGCYRLASINAAANHQPTLVAVAQHGSLDDMVYFCATADGKPDAAAAGVANVGKAAGKGAAAAAAGGAAGAAAAKANKGSANASKGAAAAGNKAQAKGTANKGAANKGAAAANKGAAAATKGKKN